MTEVRGQMVENGMMELKIIFVAFSSNKCPASAQFFS
jgi:hypothetical protein